MKIRITTTPNLHPRHGLKVGDVLEVEKVIESTWRNHSGRIKGFWARSTNGERIHLLETEAKEIKKPKYKYTLN